MFAKSTPFGCNPSVEVCSGDFYGGYDPPEDTSGSGSGSNGSTGEDSEGSDDSGDEEDTSQEQPTEEQLCLEGGGTWQVHWCDQPMDQHIISTCLCYFDDEGRWAELTDMTYPQCEAFSDAVRERRGAGSVCQWR